MVETTYAGSCNDREICINGLKQETNDPVEPSAIAICVKMDAFTAANEALVPDMSGATLTTLLTSPDMESLLMGGAVEIETESVTQDGHEQKGSGKGCLNCTSLTTEELPSSIQPIDLDIHVWFKYWAASLAGLLLLVIFGI